MNSKLVNITVANILTRFILSNIQKINKSIIPLFQVILSNISIYHLGPENTFSLLINEEWLRLIKERRYFYYQQLRHIITNCLKSILKAASVLEIIGIAINNN